MYICIYAVGSKEEPIRVKMVDPCKSRTTFAKGDGDQFYGRVFIGVPISMNWTEDER